MFYAVLSTLGRRLSGPRVPVCVREPMVPACASAYISPPPVGSSFVSKTQVVTPFLRNFERKSSFLKGADLGFGLMGGWWGPLAKGQIKAGGREGGGGVGKRIGNGADANRTPIVYKSECTTSRSVVVGAVGAV